MQGVADDRIQTMNHTIHIKPIDRFWQSATLGGAEKGFSGPTKAFLRNSPMYEVNCVVGRIHIVL